MRVQTLRPSRARRAARPLAWRCGAALLLAWLPAVAPAADSAGAAPAGVSDPLEAMQVAQLENGLTVLTLEDHTTPVVSFQIFVDVGSGDEARFTGLAHLFEHMMFRGTKHLEPEEHSRLIEARGGRINAYTSRDLTVYYEDITSEHLPLVISLEAERFANLDISEESLASEREVVISERRWRSEDSPEGRAFETLMALTFFAHPYRIPTVGWLSDLQKVSLAECLEFFRAYYAPGNLVVAIAGDFDTEETLALMRQQFGQLPAAQPSPRNPTEEPQQLGERSATVRMDVQSPLLALAWHAPATGHEDAEALDLLSLALSNGPSSRLYQRLIYGESVALEVSAAYWELRRAGLFYFTVQVRPGEDAARAEALLFEEIERLRRERVSPRELQRAKRAMEVSMVAGQGSAHALASRMGIEWVFFGRVIPLAEKLARYEAVSAEDVQRVAQRYLDPAGRNLVRVLPSNAKSGAGGKGGS